MLVDHAFSHATGCHHWFGGQSQSDSLFNFGFCGRGLSDPDDVLNLVGDYERYGKELGGDLLEGKRTLMLVLLEVSSPAERKR